MILKDGSPSLRGRLTDHVLADIGLTDVGSEFEQLAVKPRCAPQWILMAHVADQFSDISWDRRPAGLAAPNSPRPEQTEAFPVPGDHRLRFDDGEGGLPIAPTLGQPCTEEAISGGQFRLLH